MSSEPSQMPGSTTTYTQARAALAALCDEVVSSREPVIIRRRGREDVALIAASELRSLLETAHLTASPANARRLQAALRDAKGGRRMSRMTPAQLRAFADRPAPRSYSRKRAA